MRIGILTYHKSINHGAFLQAYCLSKYVQKIVGNRADVEIIDYTSRISHQAYNKSLFSGKDKINIWSKRIEFERSYSLLPLGQASLCSDNLSEIECFLQKQNYDVIIVGSDEVWKLDGMRGFPTAYWLNFDLGNCERIAYAVSARTALNKIDIKKRIYMNEAVQKFRYLGVRDQMTADLIKQVCHKDVTLNCDPAFLIPFHYNAKAYREKLNKKYHLGKNQKILGVMIPDQKLIKKLKEKLGEEYKIVALFDSHRDADINMVGIGPFEWVKVIGCLDFLVTDRFHGTVFAMKMGVPFLAVETYDTKENSKLYYLLNSNGIDNHYILYHNGNAVYEEILLKLTQLMKQCDNDKIQEVLRKEREKSISFKKELLKILNEYERRLLK